MTARTPTERPASQWVFGLAAIAAYINKSPDATGVLLRTGEIRGHQPKRRGHWRSHVLWLDAYLAGEDPPAITSRNR